MRFKATLPALAGNSRLHSNSNSGPRRRRRRVRRRRRIIRRRGTDS